MTWVWNVLIYDGNYVFVLWTYNYYFELQVSELQFSEKSAIPKSSMYILQTIIFAWEWAHHNNYISQASITSWNKLIASATRPTS
jgi:hypothetical protein